ncbi:MAG: hypothetical protein EOL87_02200 [Spartobacteria bacterium]|nr:hypothetical protein [Spartobacteria bacterium]
MNRISMKKAIYLLFSLLFAFPVLAQTDSLLVTAATTLRTAEGTNYAYILVQPTSPQLLLDRQYSVYSRSGIPGDGGAFAFRGLMQMATDGNTVEAMLPIAQTLGEDLTSLESDMNNLFQDFVPADTIVLSTKLAAIVRAATADANLMSALQLMAYRHPAIAMAMGIGYACTLADGDNVIEVRNESQNDAVIAELQLNPVKLYALPAPDGVRQLRDDAPQGNLIIKLRWDHPESLRRVSMLSSGFNVYRIDADYAESQGYDSTPPSRSQLAALVNAGEHAKKVNSFPVLVPDAQIQDPNAYFYVDDNGANKDGTPFAGNETFYYFVTASDILGRDGYVSQGAYGVACETYPPMPPQSVRVSEVRVNTDDGLSKQGLRVAWHQNKRRRGQVTDGYYVYRWQYLTNMTAQSHHPAVNRISDFIPQDWDEDRLYYTDETLTSNDVGITWWYTVRSVSTNLCGTNYSHNSAPSYGVLPNYTPPAAPTGTVYVLCGTPYVDGISSEQKTNQPQTQLIFNVEQVRLPSEINQISLWYKADGNDPYGPLPEDAISCGSAYFAEGESNITIVVPYAGHKSEVSAYCRCYTPDGRSAIGHVSHIGPETEVGDEITFDFQVRMEYQEVEAGGDCTHIPPEGYVPGYIPVQSNIIYRTDDDALSWQIYRSVDGGTKSLIAQGTYEDDSAILALWADAVQNLPNSGTVCYYGRHISADGIPSEYRLLICLEAPGRYDLPVPQLAKVVPATTEGGIAPERLKVNWFCPQAGVRYFDVWLGVHDQTDVPESISSSLSTNLEPADTYMNVKVEQETGQVTNYRYKMGRYRSGRLGEGSWSSDLPEYLVSITNVDVASRHVFFIRAVGANERQGENSNTEIFTYEPPEEVEQPHVPWPARTMFGQAAMFDNVYAKYLPAAAYEPDLGSDYPGIWLGRMLADQNDMVRFDVKAKKTVIIGNHDPNDFVFHDASQQPITPFILYRYQLTNSVFPQVSGDVVQVSPLVEDVPYGKSAGDTIIYDPLIVIVAPTATHGWVPRLYDMFYIDTQPVLRGAKYRYIMVLIDEDTKEIRGTIPTTSFTVPE